MNQLERLLKLIHAADHGQQNAQVAQAFIGFEHGAHLRQKDFWMIEGDTNTAPTEERVVLVDREIRQRLITTNIERAHSHRRRSKSFELLAVHLPLLFFARETVAQQECHLGPI